MSEAAASLFELVEGQLLVGGLVFLRVGAMLGVLPVFGERSVPERVRIALAAALSLVVAPAAFPEIDGALSRGAGTLALLGSEIIAGLLLGLAIRFFVLALQTAGTIAAQATSLAQIFGTAIVDPQPALSHVMVLAGLALIVILGLHVKIVSYIIVSYKLFPPASLPNAVDLRIWGTGHTGAMFALAFTLAAPFVIVSLLYNLALGAINRAMPQLMVAFVGAPAITFAALLLMALSLPLLLGAWNTALDGFLARPFWGP
ncbi:MAG: flagellar biosynthetic protein FliR [Pseudomonadota bacterium]